MLRHRINKQKIIDRIDRLDARPEASTIEFEYEGQIYEVAATEYQAILRAASDEQLRGLAAAIDEGEKFMMDQLGIAYDPNAVDWWMQELYKLVSGKDRK